MLPISIKKCNKGCLYLVVTVTLCYSGGVGGSPVLLLLVTQGGVGGLFFDVTCDIGGVGGSPMLPLLVTWVPGTNVTHYNHYPTSSCLLRVTVLQYKSKILACYKAQIAHFRQGIFKKMLQSTRKKRNKGWLYPVVTVTLVTQGGPPCDRYKALQSGGC